MELVKTHLLLTFQVCEIHNVFWGFFFDSGQRLMFILIHVILTACTECRWLVVGKQLPAELIEVGYV